MSGEPDWSKLPSDPLSFFQLSADFDRKSLKRAYGDLIKRFRPETHPVQFQKIREAYEALESQNRYGVELSMMSQFSKAWNPAQSTSGKNRSTHLARHGDAEFDFDDVRGDPAATYQRLRLHPRTPQDYFWLATLSDLFEPLERQMYLKWLLTGVKSFPRDPGLLRLLTDYLTAFADSKIAFSTLVTLSKLVHGDEYLQVTEQLWLRLLRQVPFETWAKAFQKCESALHFRSVRPQMAFFTVVLRRALWIAPPRWIMARKRFLDQHGSEIDQSLDEDCEKLNAIVNYYYQSRPHLKERPIFPAIDQLIETYCSFDFEEARPKISLLCDEIARSSNALAESFPTYAAESEANTLMLVSWIAYDMAVDSGLTYPDVEDYKIRELADATVMDISTTIHLLAKRLRRMRWGQFVLPFAAICLAPIIVIVGLPFWPWITVGWLFVTITGYFGWLKPHWLAPRVDQRSRQLVLQAYEKHWRPRLFRYVQACHAPAARSIRQLAESGEVMGEQQVVGVALSFAERDAAIQVFSRMQLFLH